MTRFTIEEAAVLMAPFIPKWGTREAARSDPRATSNAMTELDFWAAWVVAAAKRT
jgi:hypothetical protein